MNSAEGTARTTPRTASPACAVLCYPDFLSSAVSGTGRALIA
jgi:hypothetical protein